MSIPPIDEKIISDQVILFIRSVLLKTGKKRLVIGLSGGIDSAVSCALSVLAIGAKNIYPVILPYGQLGKKDMDDTLEIVDHLNISKNNCTCIDIKPIVDSFMSIVDSYDNTRIGNCMARVRMTVIFDIAKEKNALVMGTENKTEHILGYFTRFGDEASDVEPIRYLYKTHIYQLASRLNIPKTIVLKTPSARLWDKQTDEKEFGFSYKDADEILYKYIDLHESKEQITQDISAGVVEKVLNRMNTNEFKHHVPYVFSPTSTR